MGKKTAMQAIAARIWGWLSCLSQAVRHQERACRSLPAPGSEDGRVSMPQLVLGGGRAL